VVVLVSIGELKNIQSKAVEVAEKYGYTYRTLEDHELDKIGTSLERQFVLAFAEREIVDIYARHLGEIILGAMIAKQQMDAEIDGEQPASGKVGGPLITRAGWLGIGDDWDDGGVSITTGSPQNWIHSGTTLLGGTAGNAIRIGENAVHVVLGFGSLHPSPKIESVRFEIDGKEKPIILTGFAQRRSGLAIKELNEAMIWKKGTTVLGKVFVSSAFGATVTDIPYLLSVSYIKEPQLRVQDPADLVGTAELRRVHLIVETT
jgi:hypothetical protein